MSQEVDERVVKLSFDNEKFEKNVSKSIKSLHALNDSLKLEGAEKGFAEVEKASEQVDFDKMQGAVDTLQNKFSALEVAGMTAMVRITNKAIDTGEKLVKSLSIDQVTSGWSKYAEKTASVQTIMNATGKSVKQVNRYLSKLMWYSDETSYSFTDMTSALGSMTSSGGDIDTLIPMLEGIANATAYAGKGAAEFKRVIYNLNQAYSLGYLGLQDWNSVSGAGADSAQLMQTMIDTGVKLGKIKKGAVTINNFRDSLSKKWLDRDVMEQAFGQFSALTEAAYEAVDAGQFDQASDAIEALSGDYDELSVKAFKSAQSAKSFSDAVNATKDAVSSGWMDTFSILFGDYEEAETFWTDVANTLYDIFASGKDARNNWLKSAFDSGLDQMLDQTALGDVSDSFTELFEKSLIDSGKLTAEDIADAGGLQKAMESAGVTAQDLYDQIQMSLAVYSDAAKMSDKELAGYNVSRKTLEKTIAAYQEMADAIQNGNVNLEEYADQMSRMSGREHFFSGILNILEGIKNVMTPIRNAFDDVFMTDGSPLYNLLKGFDNLTGKFKLSEDTAAKVQKVFKGVFSVLSVGFKTIKTIGRVVLAVIEALLGKLQPLTDLLLNVGAAFGDIFTELNDRLNSAESVTDILDAIGDAIGRLMQPLKDIIGAIGALVTGSSIDEAGRKFGAFGKIVNTANAIFQNFGLGTISLSSLIGKALRVLGGVFYIAFSGVKELIGKAFGGFQDAGKAVNDFKDNNLETLENVRDTVVSLPEKAGAAMKEFAGNVQSAFYTVADACKTGLNAVLKFFHLEDGIDFYRTLSLLVIGALALAIWGVASALKALNTQVKKVADTAKDVMKNPVTDLLNSMKKAVDAWAAQHTTNNFVNVAKGISIAVGTMSASIFLLSRIENPEKATEALQEVLISLFGLTMAMKSLAKSDLKGLDSVKLFGVIASLGLGIGMLVAAIKKMGEVNVYRMEKSVQAVIQVGVGLVTMMGLLSAFNGKIGSPRGAAGLILAAGAIDAVVAALIPLANAKKDGADLDGAADVVMKVAAAVMIVSIGIGLMGSMLPKTDPKPLEIKLKSLDDFLKELTARIKETTGKVIMFVGVAAALVVAARGIQLFAQANPENLWPAVEAALATIAGIALIAGILGKVKLDTAQMLKASAAVAILSGALVVMAVAIHAMDMVIARNKNGGTPWAVTIGNLVILGGAVAALGKLKGDFLNASLSVAALSASLVLLAAGIYGLDLVGVNDAVVALVPIAAGLAVLAVALAVFPNLDKPLQNLCGAAVKLSAALLLLAPAFMILGQLGFEKACAGAVAFISLIAGLSVAALLFGAVKPMADGIKVLASAIVELAKAFSIFAGGLLKLSAAGAIVVTLLMLLGQMKDAIEETKDDIRTALTDLILVICQVIEDTAPAVGDALVAVVTMLCEAIIRCALPLGLALEALLLTLWMVIVDTISLIFTGKGTGIQDSIENGLDAAWENIVNWFANHSLWDLLTDWVTGTAHALNENGILDFIMPDLNGAAGNAGESFANWCDRVLGPWFRKSVQRSWGIAVDVDGVTGAAGKPRSDKAETAKKQQKEAQKQQKEADQQAADASGVAAKNVRDTADAMLLSANRTKDYAEGMIEIVDDTGKIHYATVEQVKALQDGEITMADLRTATNDATGAMVGLSDETNSANAKLQNGVVVAKACATEVAGSADVITQTGEKIETKQEELNTSVGDAVQESCDNAADIAGDGGEAAADNFWSRWSKKLSSWAGKLFNNVDTSKVETVTQQVGEKVSGLLGVDDLLKNNLPTSDNKNSGSGLLGDLKGARDTFLNAIADPITDPTGSGGTTTTGKKKSGSSGTKKTVAQQIEEKYKTKLEANKTQREILDNEYELWQEENQYSADIDTQMAKKAENAAAEIANQTERVTIAQQKYDEMTKRWGKDKQETKEAYNDLLEEKTSLAKLKAEQYTNLFEAATTRYDTDLDTLEKEYNLWSTQNDRSATKLAKLERETQYQNDELAIKQKKVDIAKEQYETLSREYGESDLRTIEAHNDLLDAQKDALEIQNELAQKELDRLDILIENIQTAQSLMQSRMDILSTVYDDGSLKEREDAYKQAVEEYGKDSEQAKKAQFQGTTSAIMSTVTALKNLNYQMQQTKKAEEELAKLTPGTEAYESKQSEILSSKSSFIGFASNLADALNMEDTGKRAMLILANSMQDHWKEIDTAMQNVMAKVTEGMSEGMEATFKDVFSTISSDEFAQMGTELVSTVNSALQGDWAGALASGIAFAMDFAFSDTGKKIQNDVVKLFSDNVLPAIEKSIGNIGTLVNGESGLVSVFQNGSLQIGEALAGSGGITAALGSIGTTLTEVGGVLMSFLSQFWWVFLIIGAIAAVVAAIVGGIAWSKKKKSDSAKDAGNELDKDFADGVTGGKDQVTDAVDDMTKDATDSMTAAIATIRKVMDDDYAYEPQVTPVLDLTDAETSLDSWNQAFNDYPMNADLSKKMAAQVEATTELQNEARMQSNADLLSAVHALGDRMDSVGQSIQGMNVVVDGKTTIGWIDAGLGARAARRAR